MVVINPISPQKQDDPNSTNEPLLLAIERNNGDDDAHENNSTRPHPLEMQLEPITRSVTSLDGLSKTFNASFLGVTCPADVLEIIFSYLDAWSLGRIARVSQRLRENVLFSSISLIFIFRWCTISRRFSVWNRHRTPQFVTEFKGATGNFLERLKDVRKAHIYMYEKNKQRKAKREERIARRQQIEAYRQSTGLFTMLTNSFIHDVVAMILLILFTAFLSLQMDHVIEWSWHMVALPLYIATGVCIRGSFKDLSELFLLLLLL